jgi:hypothetical protein
MLGTNTAFAFGLNSASSIFYVVESATSLSSPVWNHLAGFVGTGALVTYTNSPAVAAPAFYRLRVP